ncbi:MAG: hypothetical protein MUF21_01960 [Gemmatimonadaceae bacterium]|nr:hypothetical protein [Gemmatimonadaceae bacterium]
MPHRVHAPRIAVTLLAATLCACGDASGPAATTLHDLPADGVVRVRDCTGPATSVDPRRVPSPPSDPRQRSSDDAFAQLVRTVPGGIAGVYLEQPSGAVVLLMTDTARAADARRALANQFSGVDMARARPRPARWSFVQLYDWSRWLFANDAWTLGGSTGGASAVTMFDIDERENRLVFGVTDTTARRRVAAALARLELPCDLVQVLVRPPAVILPAR